MTDAGDLFGSELPGAADKAALLVDDRVVTYGEMNREVARLQRLLEQNFVRGDLLATWLPNCPELLAVYLACFRAGIVPVPLHPQLKWPEARDILHHAQARGLLTFSSELEAVSSMIEGTSLEKICLLGAGDVPHECRTLARSMPDHRRETPVRDIAGGPALVLHTSGTTGRPKGVMLSRAAVEDTVRFRQSFAGMRSDSVAVVPSCLTQSVGLYQSLALLVSGATIVLLRGYDIDRMVECVNRYRPTHLIMVVSAFDGLLFHPAVTRDSLASLRFAAVGADRVTPRVQDRFAALTGRALGTTYGLSESSWALVNAGGRIDKGLSLGRASPGVEVQLLDAEGREVPRGAIGEIHIRSPRTMQGYLNDGEGTRAAFRDGWLATGDLAFSDEEGYFWFAGRSKSIIVLSSGDTVSPAEIEDAILACPGVKACGVIAGSAPDGSEVPCAFVAPANGGLSEERLLEFLRARLSDYKLPRRIVFLHDLPQSAGGKIPRELLKQLV